jgi:hypothetical protein
MKRLNHLLLLSGLLLITPRVGNAGDDLMDDFSKADLKGRQALRGEWKFENKQASCVADPELYKKYKNHGPILRWSPAKPFMDGTVEMEFHPQKCQRVVITLNNKTGHVFRVALTDNAKTKTRIFGWAHPSKEKDKPSETLAQKGVPTSKDIDGQWVKFRLAISGNEAKVTIGKFSETLKHASIAREKGEFTISFASGECAVRNVNIKPGTSR